MNSTVPMGGVPDEGCLRDCLRSRDWTGRGASSLAPVLVGGLEVEERADVAAHGRTSTRRSLGSPARISTVAARDPHRHCRRMRRAVVAERCARTRGGPSGRTLCGRGCPADARARQPGKGSRAPSRRGRIGAEGGAAGRCYASRRRAARAVSGPPVSPESRGRGEEVGVPATAAARSGVRPPSATTGTSIISDHHSKRSSGAVVPSPRRGGADRAEADVVGADLGGGQAVVARGVGEGADDGVGAERLADGADLAGAVAEVDAVEAEAGDEAVSGRRPRAARRGRGRPGGARRRRGRPRPRRRWRAPGGGRRCRRRRGARRAGREGPARRPAGVIR